MSLFWVKVFSLPLLLEFVPFSVLNASQIILLAALYVHVRTQFGKKEREGEGHMICTFVRLKVEMHDDKYNDLIITHTITVSCRCAGYWILARAA